MACLIILLQNLRRVIPKEWLKKLTLTQLQSLPIKNKNLHFVINNTRFLILPWIQVKCLASKVMAMNIRRISDDWLKIYNYPLYMLETFVEQETQQNQR